MKINRLKINTDLFFYYYLLVGFFKDKQVLFLKKLSFLLKKKNILLFSQGRLALYECLNYLKNKNSKKNQIIICPYTLPEVIKVIKYLSLIPVYVDIDVKTGMPKLTDLKKKINSKTSSIILTHLYSSNKNILKTIKFIKKRKINLIEDCAINFGSEIKLKNKVYKLGTLGDFGFYSFGIMKNLCLLNGGALICKTNGSFKYIKKNKIKIKYPLVKFLNLIIFSLLINFLHSKIIYQIFTFYFMKYSYLKKNFFFKKMYPGLYPDLSPNMPNYYNYDFFNPVASCGIYQIEKLSIQKKNRIKKIQIYEKFLNKNKYVKVFKYNDYSENSFLEFPVLLKRKSNVYIKNKLLSHGIDIRYKWYKNNNDFKVLKKYSHKLKGCSIIDKKILCLPLHDDISEIQINRICMMINKYL